MDRPAHGGWCVGRSDGRVVFVRHAVPGERVVARVVEGADSSRLWRADAVDILDPSPDRVPQVWPQAGVGGVGGADLGHVVPVAQRAWKAEVISDVFERIGRRPDVHVVVENVGDDGYRDGYRTRIELVADSRGRAGMYRNHTHDIVPLADMPLAIDDIRALRPFDRSWTPRTRLDIVAPSGQRPFILEDGRTANGAEPGLIIERVTVNGRPFDFLVPAAGFWQVHTAAPAVLAEIVTELVAQTPMDRAPRRVWDLYAGSGLFTAFIGQTGAGARIVSVEGDRLASTAAAETFADDRRIDVVHAPVEEFVAHSGQVPDVIVLDPPRTGAGERTMAMIAAAGAARIVYVSCDPAALARDCRIAEELGYELNVIRAVDVFPHTHHVECVVALDRR